MFSPTPPPPSPQKTLTYFLFLWICLFCTFHINVIVQYVTFVPGTFHIRFIHVIVYINTSFLLMAQYYSTVWINYLYLFSGWWRFEVFLLFGYYEECFCKHSYARLCVNICYQFSWYITRSGHAGSYSNYSKPFEYHLWFIHLENGENCIVYRFRWSDPPKSQGRLFQWRTLFEKIQEPEVEVQENPRFTGVILCHDWGLRPWQVCNVGQTVGSWIQCSFTF